jgi:dTMP kinase
MHTEIKRRARVRLAARTDIAIILSIFVSQHVTIMANPLFIAIEGIDGSGKSTQSQLLAEKLQSVGHRVYQTFEPTDQPIGRMIRDIFAGRTEGDQKVIASLFAADRLNHILHSEHGMLHYRQESYSIISDRYYLSSYAYHGAHVDMDWVMDMNAQAVMLLQPDVHIYIDLPPEVAMARISASRTHIEMYETLDNLTAVYEKYEEAITKIRKGENIRRISGDQSIEDIAADIWRELQKLL